MDHNAIHAVEAGLGTVSEASKHINNPIVQKVGSSLGGCTHHGMGKMAAQGTKSVMKHVPTAGAAATAAGGALAHTAAGTALAAAAPVVLAIGGVALVGWGLKKIIFD